MRQQSCKGYCSTFFHTYLFNKHSVHLDFWILKRSLSFEYGQNYTHTHINKKVPWYFQAVFAKGSIVCTNHRLIEVTNQLESKCSFVCFIFNMILFSGCFFCDGNLSIWNLNFSFVTKSSAHEKYNFIFKLFKKICLEMFVILTFFLFRD